MKKTNVGDKSDVIKQKKLAQTQTVGQTGQPIQVVGSNTGSTMQMLSMFTNIDPEALKRLPDIDSIDDKPWTKPGADISDYFNYDLTEDTWRLYLMKHTQMRQELQSLNKIKVVEDKDYDKGDKRGMKYREGDKEYDKGMEYDKRRGGNREEGRGYRDEGYRGGRGYNEEVNRGGRGYNEGGRGYNEEYDRKKQEGYYEGNRGGQRERHHYDERQKQQGRERREKRDRFDYVHEDAWESERKRRR